MTLRTCLRPLLVAVLLLGFTGTGTAAALASTPVGGSLSVHGDVELAPGLDVFHLNSHSQQRVDGTTTGAFTGTGELKTGGINLPIPVSVAGPVTCLSVHGSTAAFLYPVTQAQPPLLANLVVNKTSVLFTVTKGANGAPDRVGFLGPFPSQFFRGCAPIGTPFVFHGTINITG